MAGITNDNCFLNNHPLPYNINKWINIEMWTHFQSAGDKWRHLKMNDKCELYTCTNNGSEWYHMILKRSWRKGTGFIWLRIKISEGSCEHSNEQSGSIECREFLDQWKNYSSGFSTKNPLHGISYLVSWSAGWLVGLFICLIWKY